MSLQGFQSILMEIPEYRVLRSLMLYVPPILIVVGTLGNTFSFIILRRRPMNKVSSYLYLASLAVADSFVLYIGLLRLWLGEVMGGIYFHDSSDWLCKLTISFGYMASDLSVWLIIAVTVERYIVVCFPLKASAMINTARAKRVIGALVLLMFALNLHFFWTVEIVERPVDGIRNVSNCQSGPLYTQLVNEVWPWVDACIYSFVPFIVILVLNILIIFEVVDARRHRQHMQSSTPTHTHTHHLHRHATRLQSRDDLSKLETGSSTTTAARSTRRSGGPGEGTKLTIMLLTVSFTFLITTLPMNVCVIVTAFWKHQGSLRQTTQLKLASTIAELLMYVNHSINFFLYCATGQRFRQQLVLLLSCKKDSSSSSTPWTSVQTEEHTTKALTSARNGGQLLKTGSSAQNKKQPLLMMTSMKTNEDDDATSANGETIPLRAL